MGGNQIIIRFVLQQNNNQTERTGVSDVEQHGHEDVVHQVQRDAVGEQSVPHHQQVLERELAAEEQTDPPAAGETAEVAVCMPRKACGAYPTVGGDTDMP